MRQVIHIRYSIIPWIGKGIFSYADLLTIYVSADICIVHEMFFFKRGERHVSEIYIK